MTAPDPATDRVAFRAQMIEQTAKLPQVDHNGQPLNTSDSRPAIPPLGAEVAQHGPALALIAQRNLLHLDQLLDSTKITDAIRSIEAGAVADVETAVLTITRNDPDQRFGGRRAPGPNPAAGSSASGDAGKDAHGNEIGPLRPGETQVGRWLEQQARAQTTGQLGRAAYYRRR